MKKAKTWEEVWSAEDPLDFDLSDLMKDFKKVDPKRVDTSTSNITISLQITSNFNETERFVLVNEKEYTKLKDEILALQRGLLSMIEVYKGRFESFTDPESHFSTLFDKDHPKRRTKTKSKKTSKE